MVQLEVKTFAWKRISRRFKFLYRVIVDSLAGPLENRRALDSKNIVIFPQFGIGDQLFTLSAYLELAKTHILFIILDPRIEKSAQAFLRDENITLIKGNPLESRNGYSERKQYRKLAKSLGAKILSLSDLQLRLARYGRPYEHPNALIYQILGLNPKSYNSRAIRSHLELFSQGQYKVTTSPYAVVDHFPGTKREIPQVVLDEIQLRGARIEYVPKEIPFPDLIELVDNASELHLVNSSFSCLALVLNPSVALKNIYITQNGFINGRDFYDLSWGEFLLLDSNGNKTQNPTRINREFEYSRELDLARRPIRKMLNFYFSRVYRIHQK